jgi:hypothetical protein
MSYITRLGLTLTFDARLQCLYVAKQPDWMVSVIGYSRVKFWHAHLYFKNILAGDSFGTQARA